jgi:hypothetical protein
MRRISIPLILITFVLAAPTLAQDHPRHRGWGEGFHRKGHGGPGAFLKRFIGDVPEEQKAAFKEIGKEFLDGARPYLPEMKAAAMALRDKVFAALSDEERARVKGVFAGVRSLSIPEKIGLAQGFIGALNTPELRADVRLFFKGNVEERQPAGDRVARAAAAKFVAEVAKRAEVGEAPSSAVLQAFGEFLEGTREPRAALRALAQEKLLEAWSNLTEEQKGRIKAALRFVRAWLQATAPSEPAGTDG